MAQKQCCVESCYSSSARKEDQGVTFHKFPKDVKINEKWQNVAHFKASPNVPPYVCSRHFCKEDFRKNKDLKYILKSDAVPSIFPWTKKIINMDEEQIKEVLSNEEENNESFESKESDSENLEAIKKYIEQQESEIKEKEESITTENFKDKSDDLEDSKKDDHDENKKEITAEQFEKASSVMDMILTESEAKDQLENKGTSKPNLSEVRKPRIFKNPVDKDNASMSLSIGSQVEVKDFEGDWYFAEIVEVDYEDTEVLVRYELEKKKHDEWINVSSPRLRPFTGVKTNSNTPILAKEAQDKENEQESTPVTKLEPKEELKEEKQELVPVKTEDKPKAVFEVGERCLARWRDNRRFVATVHKDLGDGQFEVIFDDGSHYTCGIARLHKMKPEKTDSLLVDTSFHTTGSPSPLEAPGPSTAPISPLSTLPIYHTHLFDPTRDYLGSKSERREKKRKLNIKEIFNIGQKKIKVAKTETPKTPVEKKPKPKRETPLKAKKVKSGNGGKAVSKVVKTAVPDAVASIIGSSKQEKEEKPEQAENEVKEEPELTDELDKLSAEVGKMNEQMEEYKSAMDIDPAKMVVDPNDRTLDEDNDESKSESDPVLEEEVILEKFEKPDKEHEQVIDKIKEAINKLEYGINEIEKIDSPRVETPKMEIEAPKLPEHETMTIEDIDRLPECVDITVVDTHDDLDMDDTPPIENVEQSIENTEKPKKDSTRIKKSKKLRLMHAKKVKRDVERVKNELARMKRKFEEMRREMQAKTQELAQSRETGQLPESCLRSGEWCCRWVNGQPVGTVSEIEAPALPDNRPALPRRSVQVEDKRLPPGWTKHMVRRSTGNSAGKWHVVLVSPSELGSKRFYTKADMRSYLESHPSPELAPYDHALMDFGVHQKLSRQMGWITTTPDGVADAPDNILPAGSSSFSPQPNKKKIGLKRRPLSTKDKKRPFKRDKNRRPIKLKLQKGLDMYNSQIVEESVEAVEPEMELPLLPLEDGYVYVGSLKVQIIENLLRCPAEGCFKNFRTKTLLQMHIKHYHRELTTMMGATPKVLDLAYARTNDTEVPQPDKKIIKVKIQKPAKRDETKPLPTPEIPQESPPVEETTPKIPRSLDSPKLRNALANRPVKRPKVLLPVRRLEPEISDSNDGFDNMEPIVEVPMLDPALDFETAISTHTVTKPAEKRKGKKSFASFAKNISEDEEMFAMTSDELDTRSSFPRSGTPDSKIMDGKIAQTSSETNEDQNENVYTYTETGERVKIVHMKREEIINCHCGIREEDGLMVQCELCLCWQHALCHNIQRECDVPEKYTCSICLNPRRGRRSRRFIHDQDRLYEGALPGARPRDSLRRAHELAGNLLRVQDALHAMRVKTYVATKKGHPKLYLWAKEWEQAELNYTQDKLNSQYSDMHVMINGIGKENRPLRADEGMTTPSSEDHENERNIRSQIGSQALLSGLLSSPGAASLDLALSTDFDNINSQEHDWQRSAPSAPQPEAAIENDACRERLLRHIQRCHALIDTRLDSIEAQVAELESQDPSFGEHYETADFYPQTKQTIHMLMRDLDTMEELGVIT